MNLAEECNTSTSYIGEIEIGRKFPSVEMIQKIAAALDIQPFQLFVPETESVGGNPTTTDQKNQLIQKLQQAIAHIVNEENF